jgi:hypothetical protein
MFFIPGFLISIATFPGVVVHELAHLLACRWSGTPVYAVCYFRVGNPSGFVVHGPAERPWQSIAIGLAPFLVNSLLGALIAFPAALMFNLGGGGGWIDVFLMWMGVSIAMHALPSTGDAKAMWAAVSGQRAGWATKIMVGPLVGLIYLMSIASVFWFNLIYGWFLCMLLPSLIVAVLA